MEPLAPDWRTVGTPPTAQGPAGTPGTPGTPAARNIPLSSRSVAWIAGVLVATALTGAAIALALVPTGGGVVIGGDVSALPMGAADEVPIDALLASTASPPADLVVDVEGAVARPGLVHVPAGGRVGDALTRAGGFAADADLSRTAAELNLAQQVTDGLKVVVPALGDAAADSGPGDSRPGDGAIVGVGSASVGGLVDLNHATESELDALPGVGPATIAKIIAARQASPFQDSRDLRTREIVGEAVFAKLAKLVTVGR